MSRTRFVHVLMLYAHLHVAQGFPFDEPPTLFPESPKLCTTEDLVLTYKPLDPSVLQGKVFLCVNGQARDDIPQEIVNNSSMVFTIPNITLEYANANIWCSDSNCNKSPLSNILLLTLHDIPEPVYNFECVVFNYYDSMTCSWERKNYTWDINLDFKWRLPQLSGDWNDCPNFDKKTQSCTWHGTSDGDYTDKSVQILISITSQFCSNYSAVSLYNISADNIVKPAKASQFIADWTNSTCIDVSWNTAHPERQKSHQLTWISKWENISKVLTINDKDSDRNAKKSELICDLHPSSSYTFTVSMKPIGPGIWSDQAVLTAQTKEARPSQSPEVKAGSFRWNPHTCSQPSQLILVDIYWKGLPEIDQNGKLISYVITRYLHSKPDQPGEIFEQPSHTYKLKKNPLLCNESYDFMIEAANKIGQSPNPSVITITQPSKAPKIPKFILELLDGEPPLLAITLLEKEMTGNYTLFWCTENNSNCDDDDSLQWLTLHRTETIINLTNPGKNLYGVSLTTDAGSSGLEWQSCINTRGTKPTKKPEGVKVKPGNQDNSLYVSWDSLGCQLNEPVITKYKVTYCKVESSTDCSDKQSVNVSDSASYEIQDLDKDQNYSVTVAGISKEGDIGPESNPVYGVPVDRSLKDGFIVMIVVFTIIGGIVLIGLFILFIKCRKKMKEKYALPTVTDLLEENGFENQGLIHSWSEGKIPGMYEETVNGDDNVTEDEEKEKENKKLYGRQFSGDSGVITDPSSPTSLGSHNNSFSNPAKKPDIKSLSNSYVKAHNVPRDQQIATVAHVHRVSGTAPFVKNGLIFQEDPSGYSTVAIQSHKDSALPMKELGKGNFTETPFAHQTTLLGLMSGGVDDAGNERDGNFNSKSTKDLHKLKANDDYVAPPDEASGHSKDYSKAFVDAQEKGSLDGVLDNMVDPGKPDSDANKLTSKATEIKLKDNFKDKVVEIGNNAFAAENIPTIPSDDYVDHVIIPTESKNFVLENCHAKEVNDSSNRQSDGYFENKVILQNYTLSKASVGNNQNVKQDDLSFQSMVTPGIAHNITSDGYVYQSVVSPDNPQTSTSESNFGQSLVSPSNLQTIPSDGYIDHNMASQKNPKTLLSDGYVDHSVFTPSNLQTMPSDVDVDHRMVCPSNPQTMPSDGYVDKSVDSFGNPHTMLTHDFVNLSMASPNNPQTMTSDGYVVHSMVSTTTHQTKPSDDCFEQSMVSQTTPKTTPSDDDVDHSLVIPTTPQIMTSDGYAGHSVVPSCNPQTMTSDGYIDHTVGTPSNLQTMSSDGYVEHSGVSSYILQTLPTDDYVDCPVVTPSNLQTMSSDGYVDHSGVPSCNPQTLPLDGYVDHPVVTPSNPQTMSSDGYVDHSGVPSCNPQTLPSDGYVDRPVVTPSNLQTMSSDGFVDHSWAPSCNPQTLPPDGYVDRPVVTPSNPQTMPSDGYVDQSMVTPSNPQTMPSDGYVDHSMLTLSSQQTMPSDDYIDHSMVSRSNHQNILPDDFVEAIPSLKSSSYPYPSQNSNPPDHDKSPITNSDRHDEVESNDETTNERPELDEHALEDGEFSEASGHFGSETDSSEEKEESGFESLNSDTSSDSNKVKDTLSEMLSSSKGEPPYVSTEDIAM